MGPENLQKTPEIPSETITAEDLEAIQQEFEDIMAEFSSNIAVTSRKTSCEEEQEKPEEVQTTPLFEKEEVLTAPAAKKLESLPENDAEEPSRAELPPQPGYKPEPVPDQASEEFETYTRIRSRPNSRKRDEGKNSEG